MGAKGLTKRCLDGLSVAVQVVELIINENLSGLFNHEIFHQTFLYLWRVCMRCNLRPHLRYDLRGYLRLVLKNEPQLVDVDELLLIIMRALHHCLL